MELQFKWAAALAITSVVMCGSTQAQVLLTTMAVLEHSHAATHIGLNTLSSEEIQIQTNHLRSVRFKCFT